MADEYDTTPVFGIARVADRPREQPRRRPAPPIPVGRHPADAASIMGIPEGHLTQPVQEAIAVLMAEIDAVRTEAEQRRHREAWLEGQVYHHPLLPVLNRRGLMREIARVAAHLEGAGVGAGLVVLQLGGIEALRARHGLAAADAALRHVAAILGAAVRQSDVVANLDGSDFAVLLTVADEPAVEAKARELADAVLAQPFRWAAGDVALTVAVGVHPLSPGEDAEAALAAADKSRRPLRLSA